MTHALDMTALQLLKQHPLDLFSVEAMGPEVYRALAKKWHPDSNRDPLAGDVLTHVNTAFDEAKRAWARGGYPNTLAIKTSTGTISYPYLAVLKFELGETYVCERHVIYAVERRYEDLARRWLDTVKRYKYPNDDVKVRTVPTVPKNSHAVGNGDRVYVILDRPRDFVRVADILRVKGPLDPAHVAWVLSRAYQIAGFLDYCKIRHLGINEESLFVEPASHHGALLGGWFYTAGDRQKILAAPQRSAHLAKMNIDAAHDTQIRAMGRRLFGAASPSEFRRMSHVNEPLKSWLLGAPLESGAAAQSGWRDALEKTFGKRKFTVMPVTTREVYP